MNLKSYHGYYKNITLEDLDNVERLMSKEDLVEMQGKIRDIVSNMVGIPDAQTRALIEQSFKRGYLAAYIIPGDY